MGSIVIAGASGFVGRALIESLLVEFPESIVIALSRSAKESHHPRLVWKSCDLFSEQSIDEALPEKIDLVYYLVHSMEPTAQLDQGSFADHDLIMADNFARACRVRGVRQLIYLGGLMPEGEELSLHLRSRLEVEKVFEEHQIPYTFFRAGLIIGREGSSFQILLKLVRRLRVMICPAWTQTLTSPVDLGSVIEALVAGAKSAKHLGQIYDLAGCGPLTYLDMMRLTGESLGLRRFFVAVPYFSTTLSRLWVCLVTNTSKYLVYPLIESLKHPMVAQPQRSFFPEKSQRRYEDLLKGLVVGESPKGGSLRRGRKTVRSVQRIPIKGETAQGIADSYFKWIPQLTRGLIAVRQEKGVIQLRLLNNISLIELEPLKLVNGGERVTYKIKRGLLVKTSEVARFEMRLVLGGQFVLIAIHDYQPALPWFIYRYTQAITHLWVMAAFRSYLMQGVLVR